MKNRRPLVGVSANRFVADPVRPVFKNMELHYAELNLVDAIYRAGGLPIVLPDLRESRAHEELIERLDGLVLAGGADVSPESYGRAEYDPRWPGDKIRDSYEIDLIKKADQRNKPVFGVCRGLQILNVAFGGTLYQDINTEKRDTLIHRDWDIYEQNVHDVQLEEGSWLEKIYGQKHLKVNTVHHQAIRDLAPSLKAVAFAPDGIVEAVEHNSGRWLRAVQWHPEWHKLDKQGVGKLELVFTDFIEACSASN